MLADVLGVAVEEDDKVWRRVGLARDVAAGDLCGFASVFGADEGTAEDSLDFLGDEEESGIIAADFVGRLWNGI